LLRRLTYLSSFFLGLAAFAGAAPAQSPAAQPQSAAPSTPVFDIAAIHVYIPEAHEHSHIWIWPFDSHFKAQNVTLSALIHWAFDMPETRILAAPAWAGTTRFSIDAKADSSVDEQMHNLAAEAARAQQEKMVQALLADRFKLATHRETRELPIYLLVVAKGGPRLGAPPPNGAFINHGRDHIEIQGYTNGVSALAEELSQEVGRDVVDKTGITGRYDLKLTWTPDDRAASAASGTDAVSPAADSGPSIFTALEEQLGLRLEPSKGPVQVLVIDRAELPSAN
jgi:uncharacterized protein (TIGR03435 family)